MSNFWFRDLRLTERVPVCRAGVTSDPNLGPEDRNLRHVLGNREDESVHSLQ